MSRSGAVLSHGRPEQDLGARDDPTESHRIVVLGDHPVGALTYDIRIENLRFQVNPDKLNGLRQSADS
ncbi:hypothetical protein [Nocardia mangyaensis]|uniref:hypothetical protein n=1 Tax=Nocardia mangyaensis TaxID=2213200 RepID=UPI0012EC261E|nr:hypothetical protein [Nocardia mangyaensis]